MSNHSKRKPICHPPVGEERIEPLPSQEPKAAEEDPEAPQRVKKLLSSASYRQADQDVDFLNQDDLRSFRLQVDFLKAERLLQESKIKHSIVVFGGTRIKEPGEAKRRVQALKTVLATKPDDAELKRKLAIAERIYAKSRYYNIAREF
ncbi:MAG: cytochrome D ubiquinol oxidase subunit II, partial [Gammaproteobacteria bacterium]